MIFFDLLALSVLLFPFSKIVSANKSLILSFLLDLLESLFFLNVDSKRLNKFLLESGPLSLDSSFNPSFIDGSSE